MSGRVAGLVSRQLALYAFVLGLICVFLIPLTTPWWIVPVLGVSGPLAFELLRRTRPAVARGPMNAIPSGDDSREAPSGVALAPKLLADPLSEREREVLALLASGRTTAEAARDLFVSVGTIKSHTANIYRKLGARNRAAAITRARERDLLP